ncbi:MAG: isoprenylcysteine carboxylmethyltransferase family protein [Rhodobacteraceae bacterium]|nr:isoprenylcysteine carboxylmethyltransferase family protein [Paracoccaceae bacterium]MCF8514288.1 isoprenylcysteine carboxylmethyltransferase family protein [Paracoccaceae bacterium]MCF8518532.1 isoprenylcysteine carboxylmethyltransferase family protein [Paracoccaceae bacterium]
MAILDLPPIWLLTAIATVVGLDLAIALSLFGSGGQLVGGLCIALGLGLMAAAVVQMMLQRTSFIPRRNPNALVTGGVFALSRNPIYLGDALVLAGVILWRDVPHAVPILPAFMMLIQHRFILDEERRLHSAFGADFDEWKVRSGRWISLPKG